MGVAVFLPARAEVPAEAGDTSDLWARATIYRDGWGTPHVYADDVYAMAFAFGYAQADDHLEAMLKAYRVANGSAAEVFGEPLADWDAFALAMRHADLAREALPEADPLTRDLCEGFARGANAWMATNPERTPPWAGNVRPEDVLALLHCYLTSLAPYDWDGGYARPAAATSGNAWAIGPSRSETGEAILAINPHTYYDGPFQWYEAHLATPGLKVAGATLFGLPVIVQGHNERLGWALTPNHPDYADIYVTQQPAVERNPEAAKQPQMGDQSLTGLYLLENTRKYVVRTPGGPQEREVISLETPHGPVVGCVGGQYYTFLVGGYHDFGALAQLFQMGAARDLAEFQEALGMFQLPCFHVVYADRDGNIFYLYNAKACVKHPPGEVDWTAPVPMGNPLFEWGDLMPPSSLPALVNPESGYIQACGNPPWTATDNSALSPEEWPAGFVLDADSGRAARVRRLLGEGQRSFQDAQAMLYDVLVPGAMAACPRLLDAAEREKDFVATLHQDLPAGLELLRDWSFVAEPNSPGMTFYLVWSAAYRSINGQGVLPTPERQGSDEDETALRAAGEAAKLMRNEFQSLSVPWGDVHRIRRGDKIAPMPGATAGDPVFVASDWDYENGVWWVTYGYGFGMVVKFGDTVEAVSMVPFGSSEDPGSRHFADQLELMTERRFKVTRFLEDEVQRQADYAFGRVITLRPLGMEARFVVKAEAPIKAHLKVAPEPAVPLPKGTAAFTVCVTLERSPAAAPIALTMDICIPPELCADDNLEQLAVYALSAKGNWTPLKNQQMDIETRRITARERAARTYVVLGPASARTGGKSPVGHIPKPAALEEGAATAQSELEVEDSEARSQESEVRSQESEFGTQNSERATRNPKPETRNPETPPHLGSIAWGPVVELRPPGMQGRVHVKAAKSIGARVSASTDPPAPLPEGLAAFTDYVTTKCSTNDVQLDITVELVLDEGVCAPQETLSNLALYGYDPSGGWAPLPNQQSDAATRTFTATDTTPRIYAVLGPKDLLLRQQAPPGPAPPPAEPQADSAAPAAPASAQAAPASAQAPSPTVTPPHEPLPNPRARSRTQTSRLDLPNRSRV